MALLSSTLRYESSMPTAVINGLLFNISWLAILTTHSSAFGPLLVALHMLIHFAVMGRGFAEVRLIAGVTLCGILIDQLLFLTGVFTIAGQSALAPLWMTCLWPVLATTLQHAFEKLQQRTYLAILLGGVGGAVSYTAGTRLTDVAFSSDVFGPLTMGIIWAILFPLLLRVARASRLAEDMPHD